jgi:hypothetical protein
MSEVTGCGILKVFFNKECKRNILGPEILVGSHRMSDRTGSTVYIFRYRCKNIYINGANLFQMKEHNWK